MSYHPNILLIGGATRNVGKTTLTCKIIEHFARENEIVGLKIKTVREGDESKHGKGRHSLVGDFLISEESYPNEDDTGKMFAAGAKRVFHIKSKHEALLRAMENFLATLLPDQMLVCESNSLREVLVPALFLMIKDKNRIENIKPSANKLQHLADHIIWSDGSSHDFSSSDLMIERNAWRLKE